MTASFIYIDIPSVHMATSFLYIDVASSHMTASFLYIDGKEAISIQRNNVVIGTEATSI
jgi:hypothetical protein